MGGHGRFTLMWGLSQPVIAQDRECILLPAHSTLHLFVKNQLNAEEVEHLMHIPGRTFCRDYGETNGIIDSTPLEISRYNRDAAYKPPFRFDSLLYPEMGDRSLSGITLSNQSSTSLDRLLPKRAM